MQRKLIFICDDDPGILEVLKIILSEMYDTREYIDDTNLTDDINKYSPNLMILDYSFLKRFDLKFLNKNIPTILTTAANNGRELTKDIVFSDFLPKPFELSQILGMVQKLI